MVIHEYMMGMKWVYNGYIRESSNDIKGRMGSCKNGGWPQIFEEGNYMKHYETMKRTICWRCGRFRHTQMYHIYGSNFNPRKKDEMMVLSFNWRGPRAIDNSNEYVSEVYHE